MKREHEKWNFIVLLAEYFELDFYFKDDESNYNVLPWFIQADLKKLESALNAITGKIYLIDTPEGRKEIADHFQTGFGYGSNRVTQEQLCQLRSLLGNDQLFDKLNNGATTVCDFYYKFFKAYKAGYKYIISFESIYCAFGEPTEYMIIDAFKRYEIDKIIAGANQTFVKCMKILLGERFKRSFTRNELIKEFNYPTTSNDEVRKAKQEYLESLDDEVW